MGCVPSVVLNEPTETSPEVTTAAGFLAGYSGRTREAYTLDLRQFIRWCNEHRLGLFELTRTHIELYARQLEEEGKTPATIGRRLSTLAGFYRYAAEEGVIEHSPAVHVRRPKLDYESHAVGLDRNELGAFLVQAGLSSPQDHALCSLLALNGLRISEALGANIDQLGLERGHRTLLVHRKGGKTITIPLAPRTARALDGTASSPPHSTQASPCETCKKPPRTPTRARRCGTTAPASPSTATPPTSWPPSSPAPAAATPPEHPPGAAEAKGAGRPLGGAP
jgi:integrase